MRRAVGVAAILLAACGPPREPIRLGVGGAVRTEREPEMDPTTPHAWLWRVSGGDAASPSYLLGTMHLGVSFREAHHGTAIVSPDGDGACVHRLDGAREHVVHPVGLAIGGAVLVVRNRQLGVGGERARSSPPVVSAAAGRAGPAERIVARCIEAEACLGLPGLGA